MIEVSELWFDAAHHDKRTKRGFAPYAPLREKFDIIEVSALWFDSAQRVFKKKTG